MSEFNCLAGNKLSLRLQNLKYLDNHIFHNKQNLTHLDLRNNRLSRLPDQICDLILLRELRVDYNFLETLPVTLNRLNHLQCLTASQNQLIVVPPALMVNNESKLQYLYLNDNKIGPNISRRIGKLQKLKGLHLHNNPIQQLPIIIGELRDLEELGLDWFMYLHTEQRNTTFKALKDRQQPKLLSILTKVLKGQPISRNTTNMAMKLSEKSQQDFQE